MSTPPFPMPPAGTGGSPAGRRADPADALIDSAFEYGFPVCEIARTCHEDLSHSRHEARLAPNAVWHDRRSTSGAHRCPR